MEKKHPRYLRHPRFRPGQNGGFFEKKFPFDPERNFKDVEIEAKNGDLGLGNGHGSKRSLFVTEDFAEEDGELQRTIIKKLLIQMYCHCLD